MKALIGIGLCAALLGGCAALPGRDGPRECSQQLGQEQELQMNMVRDMIREGRLHAALANLESMPPGLIDVREERALILRRIGDSRARAEYQALLETCKAPEAHHGLGLLALRNGDSARAVLELREATRLRSTESRFRNDLGVALLKRGDRVGARFEFITALELQQGGKLPATNLLGLLYLQGDREDAQRLIERLQLDARDIRAVRGAGAQLGCRTDTRRGAGKRRPAGGTAGGGEYAYRDGQRGALSRRRRGEPCTSESCSASCCSCPARPGPRTRRRSVLPRQRLVEPQTATRAWLAIQASGTGPPARFGKARPPPSASVPTSAT